MNNFIYWILSPIPNIIFPSTRCLPAVPIKPAPSLPPECSPPLAGSSASSHMPVVVRSRLRLSFAVIYGEPPPPRAAVGCVGVMHLQGCVVAHLARRRRPHVIAVQYLNLNVSTFATSSFNLLCVNYQFGTLKC
jgi:hypothetical protein